MIYRRLGRTNIEVSRLGFGAMRLPTGPDGNPDPEESVRVIRRAFELGVSYIDTAVMYGNGESQRVVGRALKGWRDRVCVSTKNHYRGPDERAWWKNLEDSLERLDIDCIDIYNIHGINWKEWESAIAGPNRILAWMKKARQQGLIRHICCSFHDDAEGLSRIAATDEFSVITLQYNLLDRSLERVLPELAARDIGVVVMGPVGGGRLGMDSEVIRGMVDGAQSTVEVALRFVLANPSVTVALSGMGSLAMVEENCAVASRPEPLSAREQEQVRIALERMKALSELYCTGCNYCMPCPSGVDIPGVFLAVNQDRVYGLTETARRAYAGRPGKASFCIACGTCEPKCPQKIPIRAQLQEAARRFDPAYGTMALDLAVVRGGAEGLELRARVHNVSDRPGRAEVRFQAAAGLAPEPSAFEAEVAEPFRRMNTPVFVPLADGVPGQLTLQAAVKDAKGERTENARFMLAICPAVSSVTELRKLPAERGLVFDRPEQFPMGGASTARAQVRTGWSERDFMLTARVEELETTEKPCGWDLYVLIDARDREDELLPGYQAQMHLIQASLGSASAQVMRGSLDPASVRVATRREGQTVEFDLTVPWEAVIGPEAFEVRTLEAGTGIGFDAVLMRHGGAPFCAAWNANLRVGEDGRSGCLFLA